MGVPAYIARYIYAEKFVVDADEKNCKDLIGKPLICLYLELDPGKAADERKVISLGEAVQLRNDLNKLIAQSDESFLPPEDWTPDATD